MNNTNVNPNSTINSSFSIRSILQLVRSYAWELIRFSWIIVILAILLGGYLYYNKSKIPARYIANYSFLLNESSGTDRSFIQQVLGSGLLGVTSGGSPDDLSGGGRSQVGVLQELLKTRKILSLALFKKVSLTYGDTTKEDYFINHYIDLFGLREQWIENESPLAEIHFTHDSIPAFSRLENSTFKLVYGHIKDGHLSDEISRSGILTITISSVSEQFSFEFAHTVYDVLNEYYTTKSVEKQSIIYNAAKNRRDSLRKAMDAAEQDYISYLNTHNASSRGNYATQIETQYLARMLSGEMEAYFMAIRNTEAAKIALEQQTPLLQTIDDPLLPLGRDRPNAFLYGIVGALAGTFLGTFIIVGRKLLIDLIKKEKEKQTPPTQTQSSVPPTAPTP